MSDEHVTQIDQAAAKVRERRRLDGELQAAYAKAYEDEIQARYARDANSRDLEEAEAELDSLLAAFRDRLVTVPK